MNIKTLVLFTVISTPLFASTIPFNANFFDKNSLLHGEGSGFNVGKNLSAGYLDFHKILPVVKKNPYLFYPNFDVGVIDIGIYSNHEDLHKFIQKVPSNSTTPINKDSHGTGSVSVSFGSEINNQFGTHGVSNTKILYTDRTNDHIKDYKNLFLKSPNIRIITQSTTLEYCSSFRAQSAANYKGTIPLHLASKQFAINTCKLTEGDIFSDSDRVAHIKELQKLREFFISKPNTLFVLSAGNLSRDASSMNGGIHYTYTAAKDGKDESLTFKPLNNVLVVGAMGYDDKLHIYSNYGESVDIAVISGVIAAHCADTNGSYYYSDDTEDGYGIYKQNSDFGLPEIVPCNPEGHGNGNNAYNGTSASAPIAAGIASIMLGLDNALSPNEVKKLLVNHVGSMGKVTNRHTGIYCSPMNLYCPNRLDIKIPITNLESAINAYEPELSKQVDRHISEINEFATYGKFDINDLQGCHLLWERVPGEKKQLITKLFKAVYAGDSCLYFRGNANIISYDIDSGNAMRITHNDPQFPTLITLRNFVYNLSSAQENQTWRQGYGVGLNEHGNVACLSVDGSACTQPLTTPQQCENIWEALTGVSPNAINKVASISENGVCKYANPTEENVIVYDSNKGETKRYVGVDYYSIFPEELDDNKLYTIIDKNSHLYSNKADAFPYKCEVFLNKVFPEGVPKNIVSYEGAGAPCFYTVSEDFFIRTTSGYVRDSDPLYAGTAICNDELYKKLNRLFPNPDLSKPNILNDMFEQALDELLSESTHHCSSRSILYRYGIKDGIWYNTYGYIFK